MARRGFDDYEPIEVAASIVYSDGDSDAGEVAPGDSSDRGGRGPRGSRLTLTTPQRWGAAVAAIALFAGGVAVGRSTLHVESGTPLAGPVTSASVRYPASVSPDSSSNVQGAVPSSPAPRPEWKTAVSGFMPGDIQSIAAVGDRLVVLAPGYLGVLARNSEGYLYPESATAVGLPFGDPSYGPWELISDGTMLWMVDPTKGLRMYEVDLHHGILTRLASQDGTVDLAVLDGHLYQDTAVGVFEVVSGESPATDPVARGGLAMAADPTHHRLLLLNNDGAWVVQAYAPGAPTPTVTSPSLPLKVHSLAVMDNGAIWVAGSGRGRGPGASSDGVLARLDPSTLGVMATSDMDDAVPTGYLFAVATGQNLWLRGSEAGDQLWCVDADTGAIAQHWDAVPGQIVLFGGRAYAASGDFVGELPLNTVCAV